MLAQQLRKLGVRVLAKEGRVSLLWLEQVSQLEVELLVREVGLARRLGVLIIR